MIDSDRPQHSEFVMPPCARLLVSLVTYGTLWEGKVAGGREGEGIKIAAFSPVSSNATLQRRRKLGMKSNIGTPTGWVATA